MATNNLTAPSSPNMNDYITIDSTSTNTASYKRTVGYTLNTASSWDYDGYNISNDLLNELRSKYGGDYLNYTSGLIWSRNIMGYSLQIKLKGTSSSSADSKYSVNLSVRKTFKIMEKIVYFSTDDELTDWFDRHSPVKIIESLTEQARKLVTELNNFESVLDFELNL